MDSLSGVLTAEQLENAEWGELRAKVPGSRSKKVFDVDAFQVADTAAPPTPIQHTVYQLTNAKVIVQPTPDGYAAPVDPSNFLVPWATAAGTAAGKKRKRTRDIYGDDDSDRDDEEEEENDDDDEGSS